MTAFTELRSYLASLPEGEIANEYVDDVCERTEGAWLEIDKSQNPKMTAQKISRAKAFLWQPPCLVFEIERHGGVVQGSSRAELQSGYRASMCTWRLEDRRRQANQTRGQCGWTSMPLQATCSGYSRRASTCGCNGSGDFEVRVYTEQAVPETTDKRR